MILLVFAVILKLLNVVKYNPQNEFEVEGIGQQYSTNLRQIVILVYLLRCFYTFLEDKIMSELFGMSINYGYLHIMNTMLISLPTKCMTLL